MTEKILAVLAHFIIATISASGYGGVALLMGIESACVPLPSEIIMPFAGYLVHLGQLKLFWVATAGAIGCNLGSAVAYWIGAYGGRPMVERFGRYVLLGKHDLDRTTHFFNRFGGITVFVARLLPVVRTFIALPAGIARMPQLRFHIYTFLGSWPWCFVLAYVGAKLGQGWDSDPRFKAIFHRFHTAVVLVLLISFVWFVWSHWRRSRNEPETA
ncbi:DedA family protein [Acidipila rosea]|uniref:Membrane protein DedA with SNARE-associated domain n=1 Tax=Acidipila rosea TaxID=768535 RepID=A0A4R1L210_9BACT|nr:DedA family protein [Acidipila rosea]TCK70179.1 membrane protein DedA with SNARE-associated domain [Acidipila rosea]